MASAGIQRIGGAKWTLEMTASAPAQVAASCLATTTAQARKGIDEQARMEAVVVKGRRVSTGGINEFSANVSRPKTASDLSWGRCTTEHEHIEGKVRFYFQRQIRRILPTHCGWHLIEKAHVQNNVIHARLGIFPFLCID
jgi:hypothetical protein